MAANTNRTTAGDVGRVDSSVTFSSPHQELLKELYKLRPEECLHSIAGRLREILNCETVCILLWNEGRQKLRTVYESGLPEGLKPEEYGPNEGITGKTIFSDGKRVRCTVDMKAHRVLDELSGQRIDDKTTNWKNMEIYAGKSVKGGFRSLLGAPFFVRNQKLGAVKLINKLDEHDELAKGGFSDEDVETLFYFLNAIEHVVEIKRNEEQVQSLLHIGQKIISQKNISTVSDYQEILNAIAASCANTLNYRICLIRLLEENRLPISARNTSLLGRDYTDVKHTPSLSVVENKTPLKCTYAPENNPAGLHLIGVEVHKKIKLTRVSSKFLRFLNNHDLKSFLIVPIERWGSVIGTMECYTSQPREFFRQELDAIRTYIDAVVITTLNSRQQSLLTNLIELQRIGAISGDEGGEEKAINGVLMRTRGLLGRRLKVLAAAFSEERLARTSLHCRHLYGVSKTELKSELGEREYEELFSILGGGGMGGNKKRPRAAANSRVAKTGHRELDVVKAQVTLDGESAPVGLLVLGVHGARSADNFTEQVAQISASHLGVTLANIEEFRRSKGLLKIINAASAKESLDEIYDFILNQTTDFFGFDFGAISRVEHMSRRIEMVKSRTVNPGLIDPEKWRHLSSYQLEGGDILNWVYENKRHEIINADGTGEPRDGRLNEEIYTGFKHRDLARIWVPFIFRKAERGGEQKDDLVLGIIEAGYHRQTQERINAQKSDLFVHFIDSCANSLQRVTLLEERKSVDGILERFNQVMQSGSQERRPKMILEKLLEESVELVRGDWGDITFLSHYDDKISFRDEIAYKLPPMKPGQMIRELEVGPTGQTGIIGRVAWEGKPYWSNDVNNDGKYVKEVEGVRSELAVPLRFSGRVIGVLDINSNEKDWFNERKANLVQTLADQGTALYQNARIVEPLYKLISPFNPFASPREIYDRVVEIIEDFLHTRTVSVWEKRIPRNQSTENQFELELVAASDGLREKYQEARISMLPQNCFTGLAATGKVVEVDQQTIKTEFITAGFAEANELRSMTAVPMSVGNEVYGAIDVFSRRDTKLFAEEAAILCILASKAAIALQSATLIKSFNEVARILPGEDIKTVLEGIAKSALARLHADPVILFRYDAETRHLDQEAITAGTFYFPEVKIVTTKNEMAKMILKLKESRYLKSEADYLEFEREVNRDWHSDRFAADFWHREQIESLAALKLEYGGELVGMMFINYREPQVFPDSEKRLMEVFAAQAASVIYNAKTWERNNRYWEIRRADSLSLSVSEVVSSLAHNSGNLLHSINVRHGLLVDFLSNAKGNAVPKGNVVEMVNDLDEPLNELTQDFNRLKDYRRFDKLNVQPCDINELIRQSLHLLRAKFDSHRIVVDDRKLAAGLPEMACDRNQMQHVLLNFFLNAADAMPNKGRLSVATKVVTDERSSRLQIRISDTGGGIAPDDYDKIFEPSFTTKKVSEGTGMGLPISKYIVEKHGGDIEFTSKLGKGTTFFVYLPFQN